MSVNPPLLLALHPLFKGIENMNGGLERGADAPHEQTFGEKAVLDFNPSNMNEVDKVKAAYAGIIDHMHTLRMHCTDPEMGRLASIAITEAQGAQMWAVKALTWKK